MMSDRNENNLVEQIIQQLIGHGPEGLKLVLELCLIP